MNIIDIIEKKKKGEELTKEEIYFSIEGILNGRVADYQMSALLMAICLKGMTIQETTDLTLAMKYSGDVINLSEIGKTVVDKHSTGGIGDKTTLIVGPIMAALNVPIAKMSGRGLGITGGTIDKLDSIPGFSSEVSDEKFIELVKTVGLSDIAQTKSLAPADKKLYALRDVTGTVDSIPLIASSIMSKKLASGAEAIVLDVKCGTGAFMRDLDSARELADTMIKIAELDDRDCTAVISDMNQPLGYTVGNLLEVIEAAQFLTGKVRNPRLYELIRELCKNMYILSDEYMNLSLDYYDKNTDLDKDDPRNLTNIHNLVYEKIDEILKTNAPYEKFKDFISAQGGDASFVDKLLDIDLNGKDFAEFTNEGYKQILYTGDKPAVITKIDAEQIGRVSLELGAGRIKKEDEIDLFAGVVIHKVVGDTVSKNDAIMTIYSKDKFNIKDATEMLEDAIIYSDVESYVPEAARGIVLDVI